jgi:broad specificity phosphatase PhoE
MSQVEKHNRKLILIRHGEAEHMVGKTPLTGGWSDTALTTHGRAQARQTGLALAREKWPEPFRFWTSDLLRARQTAGLIGEARGRRAEPIHALREFNNGIAAGMTREAAKPLEMPVEGPVGEWHPYEGSENWLQFMDRVDAFYDRHLREGSHLVVCHSGTAFNLMFRFLGLDRTYVGQVFSELDPCGITRLSISPFGERPIQCLNERSHLANLVESRQ